MRPIPLLGKTRSSASQREPPGHSSVAIYPSWDAFVAIHVGSHAAGAADILFARPSPFDGATVAPPDPVPPA